MMTNQTATTSNPHVDISDLPAPVRWRRALRALARVLKNPDETDQVLIFTNYVNAGTNADRFEDFYADAGGQQLFDEQATLDSHTIDLEALYALPSGTLGHAYASFMKRHGLTPNVFDGPPDDVLDPRRSYVIQRMRQTHDLWHVVTNAETDPAGEVALQAFYFAHVGAPSSGILAALGTLRTLRHDRRIIRDVFDMIRLGKTAGRLAVFRWEDHWRTPLTEVRRLLELPEAPRSFGGYTKGAFETAA
jgi:ubiquinone biosynthesis protein COQ4